MELVRARGLRRSPRRIHGAAGQEAGARRGQARATGRLCWSAVVFKGPAAGGAIVGGFNLVHVGKPLVPSHPGKRSGLQSSASQRVSSTAVDRATQSDVGGHSRRRSNRLSMVTTRCRRVDSSCATRYLWTTGTARAAVDESVGWVGAVRKNAPSCHHRTGRNLRHGAEVASSWCSQPCSPRC